MEGERVEFVDGAAPVPVAADELTLGRPGGRPPGRRPVVLLVGAVVLALVATVLVTRATGGGDDATPRPSVSATTSTPVTRPVFGLIGLPRAIGAASALVAAQSGDAVWMLDHGAGIVRIDSGTVTRTQLLEAQATAIAVSPDGTRLYVATAGDRPALQELDARTLALGPSRPLDRTIQALAVSLDAVWATSGARLLRLDKDSLATFASIALPGVILADHLRVGTDSTSDREIVTAEAATAEPDGTVGSRPLLVDQLTQQLTVGASRPGEVEVATAKLLTWVSYLPPGSSTPVTQGFARVTDAEPAAEATPALPKGTQIFDGGAGFAAFLSVAPDSSVLTCHDDGGFATGEVDVAPSLQDAVITGPVVRTGSAFYVGTDRGLVRAGAGACP